ncbi:MAG: Hpt domain-containing protein [Bacteroidota bacterium]
MTTTGTKLFDLSFLEQMDDQAFIIQVINLYLQDTASDLETMRNDFSAGDLDSVYKTAHKLKSSTGMLQANGLFGILEKTEKTAKAGSLTGELTGLMESGRAEFEVLKLALEAHLQQLPAA